MDYIQAGQQLLIHMSKVPTNIQPYLDENRYWNHGDNPVFKKFMKIAMENGRGKQVVDHRTHFIDRGVRISMARNFDDFLQRDVKANTFLRSFCVWTLSSLFLYYTTKVVRRLVPVGKFGIRKINQTQFYQNFGWIGVAAVGGWWFATFYTWWKCTRFTTHKFYRHVIQQNRSWIHESLQISKYGNYAYPEEILSTEDNYNASIDKKIIFSLPEQDFKYGGPFSAPERKKTDQTDQQ